MKQKQAQSLVKKAEASDFQILSALKGRNVIIETAQRTYLAEVAEVGKNFIRIQNAFKINAYGESDKELADNLGRLWGDKKQFECVVEDYAPKAVISCAKVERILPFEYDLSERKPKGK